MSKYGHATVLNNGSPTTLSTMICSITAFRITINKMRHSEP
jgi:hypothetical protein